MKRSKLIFGSALITVMVFGVGIFLKRREKEMAQEIIKSNGGLNKHDIKELTERIKGMTNEELKIVVKQIPNELLLDEIYRRLNEAEKFKETITNAINTK